MSRTKRGSKGPGYEYGSRRLYGWPSPGRYTKRRTHRKERRQGKRMTRRRAWGRP